MAATAMKVKTRYDLPLNKSGGSKFIIVLITLMTFLSVLSVSATLALNSIASQWTAGLQNQITIEIPAEAGNADVLKINVKKKLDTIDTIRKVDVLSEDSIVKLLSPWLGEEFALDDVPMPSLIAIEAEEVTPAFLNQLRDDVRAVHPTIRLDTHEAWLNDFLQMIGFLRFATFFVSIVIGVSAGTAIMGVIRARLSEHKDDLELLHLMGASDDYIAAQFQRYALRLGLIGGAFGLCVGAIALAVFSIGVNNPNQDLLPQLNISAGGILILLSLPMFACALCAFTAKITVLRNLARMP